MRSPTSKAITIFEGPDGGGKSTIAQEYAQLTQARYVHHGPYKQVTDGLARMVYESMLPALLGYEDVVLDRCWISEPIYADAFREGRDRVGPERARMMDRVAMRCGAVVVRCLPPWAFVKATFNGRKDEEYLDDDQQLLRVYGDYQHDLNTHLHGVDYDWTQHVDKKLSLTVMTAVKPLVELMRAKNPPHSVRALSAGNWNAPVVIVGDSFAEHKNNDAMYQLPFVSMNGNGCSMWLARQLAEGGVSEQSLLWINADQLDETWLAPHRDKRFVALGDMADGALTKHGIRHTIVPHPQYWKRFQATRPYPLIKILKEMIRDAYSY